MTTPEPSATEMEINPFDDAFWVQVGQNLANTTQTIILKLIYAIIVLIIGYIIIAIIGWVLRRALSHTKMNPLVQNFVSRLVVFILKLILWTFIIGILELDILSVSALIAAVGVAVGFTLSGLLGNFISGCIILTKEPFSPGDWIQVGGVEGAVKHVDLFMTALNTGDNKAVFVPNGIVAGGTIVNVTVEEKRRLDLTIAIGYDAEIKTAIKVLGKIVRKNKFVLKDPAPVITCNELAESTVNIVVRPWCKSGDYWAMRFALIEEIKVGLGAAGFAAPHPQLDVHIFDGVKPVAKEIEYSEDSIDEPVADTKTDDPKKSSSFGKAKQSVSNAANKAKAAVSSVLGGKKKEEAAPAKKEEPKVEEEEEEEEEEEYEYEYEDDEEDEDEEEEEESPVEDKKKKKGSSSKK